MGRDDPGSLPLEVTEDTTLVLRSQVVDKEMAVDRGKLPFLPLSTVSPLLSSSSLPTLPFQNKISILRSGETYRQRSRAGRSHVVAFRTGHRYYV